MGRAFGVGKKGLFGSGSGLAILILLIGLVSNCQAAIYTGFLTGVGGWKYDHANRVFSDIPLVEIRDSGGLSLRIGDVKWFEDSSAGFVADETTVAIVDSADNVLLDGHIERGTFSEYGNGALFYTDDRKDFIIDNIYDQSHGIVSLLVSNKANIMINLGMMSPAGNILSGNCSLGIVSGTLEVMPEPATLFLIGLGSLVLIGKKS